MLKIENENLIVRFRLLGAELISAFDKTKQREHLWQADKEVWGWHAPVLFPIVGRAFNDIIKFEGKEYEIEKHGFARKSEFELVAQTDESITFCLRSNAETLVKYPFEFNFSITYSLDKNKLTTTYTIENLSNKNMPFCIGGHPAFSVPFNTGEQYEDYYFEFPNDEKLERNFINEEGFFNGEKKDILNGSKKLALGPELFKDDALIFKDIKSKTVYLKSINHSDYLSFNFEDFKYLGLWAKTRAKYVCIEPWIGCADENNFSGEFIEKEAVITLSKGKTFSCNFTLGIHQE